MIKTFKVMLCPSNKQRTKLFECIGTTRRKVSKSVDYNAEYQENI